MNRVYSMPRVELVGYIKTFLQLSNVETEYRETLSLALKTYAEINLDFVDCILIGYKNIYGAEIITFDKKMSKYL